MKKYRAILFMAAAVYLLLAAGLYWEMHRQAKEQDMTYRVEINRYMEHILNRNSLPDDKELDELAARGDYVQRISCLPAGETSWERIEEFYAPRNGMLSEIRPLGEEDVKAYIRFDYICGKDNKIDILLSEAALLLLFLLFFAILLYLERRILRPFREMSSLPYELSKGDLTRELKESEDRYFGKFLWGLGMLKDSLEYHKDQELKLARDKKMLLLSISHDIKTPVNAISLYAKAIERGIYETEGQRKEAAVHIQKKAAEINEFVKEIIRSSTEEVVAIEVKKGEFYLKELVARVKAAYREKCSIQKVRFTVQEFENCLLQGDVDRAYEAACNLMENAIKYGDGGCIEIAFGTEEDCSLFIVRNSGIPVEENEMPHLFESFFRGENAAGKKGNGLGLYICREIMRKCGGDIFAVRNTGGMEFVLVFGTC